MKPRLIVLGLMALIALAASASMAGAASPRNFVAPLSPGQEVPPVEDSNGTGVAKFQLNKNGDALAFKLNVANIDDVTQAHIHCGAAGDNGPVVAFLFGFADPAVTVNGILSAGVITSADMIPRPDSAVCPGGVANFDELIQKIRDGLAYVNVHTVENPGGEIRGQIK